IVEPLERLVHSRRLDLRRNLLPLRGPQAVDRESPRHLREPRLDRAVVPQTIEVLVRPGEDLLEHVLRVCVAQPKALSRDRVDVAGEPLDQLAPGLLVAAPAARDERSVRKRPHFHRPMKAEFRRRGKKCRCDSVMEKTKGAECIPTFTETFSSSATRISSRRHVPATWPQRSPAAA